MLIPGKSHSRVERRNSRISNETLDFARVCTFCRRDLSWIAGGHVKGEGRSGEPADNRPSPFTPPPAIQSSNSNHSGYRRMRTIDQQQAVARQKCHKKDSRVLLTSLVIVYNKWLTCSFIWYQLFDTLHTSENYCLYINNNILRHGYKVWICWTTVWLHTA